MQMANQFIPNAAKFDHIFSKNQKRNRVELVTDFPENNEAEIIHALQVILFGNLVFIFVYFFNVEVEIDQVCTK